MTTLYANCKKVRLELPLRLGLLSYQTNKRVSGNFSPTVTFKNSSIGLSNKKSFMKKEFPKQKLQRFQHMAFSVGVPPPGGRVVQYLVFFEFSYQVFVRY